MRKVFVCVLLFTSISYSQLIDENFDYTTGTLTTQTSNWAESPTGSTDIQIVSGSLSYTDYPSSGIGNKIQLNGGATGRSGVIRTFTAQSGNGTTVYYSYLLYVTSTADLDSSTSLGEPISNLKVSGSSSFRASVFVRQGANTSKFQIGLGKLTSSTAQWYGTELDLNVTYLIVAAYVFQAGDDAVKLWINPSLSGSEPSADVSQTTGSDAASLAEIQFRQGEFGGDMDVDGIRVATSWSQAPLPVELTSFIATTNGNLVTLNWTTATEVNNYGFNIERAAVKTVHDPSLLWETICFVQGHGNCHSSKEYSFTDSPTGGKEFYYRLKQMDFDGSYQYSEIVSVSMENIYQLKLEQNYPNPFNPHTTIKYTIPSSPLNPPITKGRDMGGVVTLKVYNVLGELVTTLVNEQLGTGIYEVEFNGSNLTSGIYYLVLQSNDLIDVKKCLLIK